MTSDPRAENVRHDLGELLVIVSVLCGATSCVEMAAFGRAKESILIDFLSLAGDGARGLLFQLHEGELAGHGDCAEIPPVSTLPVCLPAPYHCHAPGDQYSL